MSTRIHIHVRSTTATATFPDGRTEVKTWHGPGAYEQALLWRDAKWWGTEEEAADVARLAGLPARARSGEAAR